MSNNFNNENCMYEFLWYSVCSMYRNQNNMDFIPEPTVVCFEPLQKSQKKSKHLMYDNAAPILKCTLEF